MGLGIAGCVLIGDLFDLMPPGRGKRFFEQPRSAVERDERTDLLIPQAVVWVDDGGTGVGGGGVGWRDVGVVCAWVVVVVRGAAVLG